MNELMLYEIIRTILAASTVMEGRFIVAEDYGNDLNAPNFADMIKDALSAYKPDGVKYPVSVLMPPIEIVESYDLGWSRFKMEHFFLCTSGYTGKGGFKDLNLETNIDEHPIKYDWKDMREVAGNFRKTFNTLIRQQGYMNYVNSPTDSRDYIRRVSKMGNDMLAGVQVSYELRVAMPCTIYDYPVLPTLPPITNFHPLHKH